MGRLCWIDNHPGIQEPSADRRAVLESDVAEQLKNKAFELIIQVNQQRRENLDAVTPSDPKALQHLVYGGIDPMLAVMEKAETAHLFRFGCKMVMVEAHRIPALEWWSGSFHRAVKRLYPNRSRASYRRLGYLANSILNCYAINGLSDSALPLVRQVKKASRKMLAKYIEALIVDDAGTMELFSEA